MFKSNIWKDYSNGIFSMFYNSFMNFKIEMVNYVINFITILFYIGIFAVILNKTVQNYLQFLLPGLLLFNMLSAVSYQSLKIWSLGSTAKLMNYWLSLPYSINFLLISFTLMVVFNALTYTIPLVILGYIIHSEINLTQWLVIIILTSIFLFFLNFLIILYFFKTNSFVIVFNVSQPLLLRISPIFYPLIFLPLFALPLSYLNPLTWSVLALRDELDFEYFFLLISILNIFFYFILVKYWKIKIKNGDLI